MMYASRHPDRIEALFLQSPAGSEAYNEEMDPYAIRISDESPNYPTKK